MYVYIYIYIYICIYIYTMTNEKRVYEFDISWQNQIYIISFLKSIPAKDNRWKTPKQVGKLYPRKSKKVIFQQTKTEDNHTNIKIALKKTGSNNHYSLISLNISGLKSPRKRHTLTYWIWKPSILLHIRVKDKHYLRVEG
jgi:prolyl oligopeptidase PreP (S9A serine peptidase family)